MFEYELKNRVMAKLHRRQRFNTSKYTQDCRELNYDRYHIVEKIRVEKGITVSHQIVQLTPHMINHHQSSKVRHKVPIDRKSIKDMLVGNTRISDRFVPLFAALYKRDFHELYGNVEVARYACATVAGKPVSESTYRERFFKYETEYKRLMKQLWPSK